MTNTVESILLQHREMKNIAEEIYQLKKCYVLYGQELEMTIKGKEGHALCEASEKIAFMLGKISEEIDDIAHEILIDVQSMENNIMENGAGTNG